MSRKRIAGIALAAVLAASWSMAQDPQPAPPAPAERPPSPAPAGEPAPPPEGDFFETIDVNVVNVEVFVTDKKGNRIKGLKREDFELFEDRKPIAITNFYAVEEGEPVLTSEGIPQLPVARPGMPTEVPEDQRLHLVVYVDNFNIRPFNRNRVFVSLREFLRAQLSPGDSVMLMTYDREPHVRRTFTRDHQVIASALHEIEKMSAMGTQTDRERREVLEEIEELEDPNRALQRAEGYANSLLNDVSFSLDSLKETVSSLAGLPGRKAILYVSDGLPMVVGQDVFQAVQEKFSGMSGSPMLDSLRFDESRRYAELASQANANRISFYTIDAAGLRVSQSVSAEYDRQLTGSSMVDSVHTSNLQSSIQYLAEATGGKAIYNTNDPGKGLLTVADDFKSYYSLGYSPSHSGSGRYHKVEVRAKRKDLVVRHREGYRDKTAESRMADGVISALFYDVESNGMGISIQRGRETPRDDGHFTVPIEVRIPINAVTLLPRSDFREAKLRVFFAAMDSEGGLSEVQQAEVPFTVPEAEVESALKQVYVYSLSMVMRRGPQKLAVGVRDEIGAIQSFAVRTVSVGAG